MRSMADLMTIPLRPLCKVCREVNVPIADSENVDGLDTYFGLMAQPSLMHSQS